MAVSIKASGKRTSSEKEFPVSIHTKNSFHTLNTLLYMKGKGSNKSFKIAKNRMMSTIRHSELRYLDHSDAYIPAH